jgi:hypothetical protein
MEAWIGTSEGTTILIVEAQVATPAIRAISAGLLDIPVGHAG